MFDRCAGLCCADTTGGANVKLADFSVMAVELSHGLERVSRDVSGATRV